MPGALGVRHSRLDSAGVVHHVTAPLTSGGVGSPLRGGFARFAGTQEVLGSHL
ncbi:hypothetical protein [Streptomyces sp. NPDC005423]|uniref:hypothetical protein n=1 Tax=Streptomyces sp. NPDC005423 TaxID=3155343 RepID=UPI0033A9178D